MFRLQIEKYEDVCVYNIYTDEQGELPWEENARLRVSVPATVENQIWLIREGFFPADRMIKATINLRRCNLNFDRLIRMPVIKSADYMSQIEEIAFRSFPIDRRFNVDRQCNPETANKVIRGWIESLDIWYVCLVDSKVAGFAAIKKNKDNEYEICLAAVDQKYRTSSVAISLYATLIKECINLGGNVLYGWISTLNMPVLNLYSSLGAFFSNPTDVFIKAT